MKFLIILLLGLFSVAYGQTIISQPYAFQKYITVKDSAAISGRLMIPNDTTINKYGIAQIGSVIYSGNGVNWTASGGGIGDSIYFVKKADSITKYVTPTQLGNSGYVKGSGVANSVCIWNATKGITYTNAIFADTLNGQFITNSLRIGKQYDTAIGQLINLTAMSPQAQMVDTGTTIAFRLPNATTLQAGWSYDFYNDGTGYDTIYVSNKSSNYLLPSGGRVTFIMIRNYDSVGVWDARVYGNKSMSSGSSGIVVNGKVQSSNGLLDSTSRTGIVTPTTLTNDSTTIMTAVNSKGTGTITGVTAGIDLTGGGTSGTVTVNADTTTGATKLATQGYVTRNSGSGGLTGGFTVSSTAAPILFGSVTNSKISGSQSRITIDTSKSVATIILDTAGGSLVNTTTPPSIDFGNSTTTLGNLGKYPKLILEHNSVDLSGICTGIGSLGYTAQNSHYWYTGGCNSPTQTMSLDNSGNLQAFSFTATPSYLSKGFEIYESGLVIQLYRNGSFNGINSGIYGVSFANSGTVAGQMFSTGRWYFGASPSDDGVNIAQFNGSIKLETAGNKINIATGTNASIGTATLSSGTVTVSTTAVTSSSKIFVTHAGSSISNAGTLYIGTISANTSFIINSTNSSDNDSINWWIVN